MADEEREWAADSPSFHTPEHRTIVVRAETSRRIKRFLKQRGTQRWWAKSTYNDFIDSVLWDATKEIE